MQHRPAAIVHRGDDTGIGCILSLPRRRTARSSGHFVALSARRCGTETSAIQHIARECFMKRAPSCVTAILLVLSACSTPSNKAVGTETPANPTPPTTVVVAPLGTAGSGSGGAAQTGAGGASSDGQVAAGSAGATAASAGGSGGATAVAEWLVCSDAPAAGGTAGQPGLPPCPPTRAATPEECRAHGFLFIASTKLCTEECGPAFTLSDGICKGSSAGGRPRCKEPTPVRRCLADANGNPAQPCVCTKG